MWKAPYAAHLPDGTALQPHPSLRFLHPPAVASSQRTLAYTARLPLKSVSPRPFDVAGSQCTISYTARLPDGTVFDARSEEEPLTFTTDEGEPLLHHWRRVEGREEGELLFGC